MDVLVSAIFFFGALLFAFYTYRNNKLRDQNSLEKELDADFSEEFDLPESPSGEFPQASMEKIVDWLEADLKEDPSNFGSTRVREPEDLV